MPQQKRQYFRITYDQTDAPKFQIGKDVAQVIDISECGLNITRTEKFHCRLDQPVRGMLIFPDGKNIIIAGKVIRLSKDKVAIKLTQPIALSEIRAEERRVLLGKNKKQAA